MKPSALRNLIHLIIVIAWAASMAMLFARHESQAAQIANPHRPERALPEEYWMGAYMQGDKIGWTSYRLARDGGGYRVEQSMKLMMKAFGQVKEVESTVSAVLDAEYTLVSFDAMMASDAVFRAAGSIEGHTLRFTTDVAGRRESREMHIEKIPSLDAMALDNLIANGVSVGGSASIPVLDPTSLTVTDMTVTVEAREQVVSYGKTYDAFRLKIEMKGLEMTAWTTKDGEVLREETPMGITFVRESPEDAQRIGKPSHDMIVQSRVPFNLDLPEETRYLKARLSGIKTDGLVLDGGRQRMFGDTLVIERESMPLPAYTGPLPEEAVSQTKPSLTAQSADPAIVAEARRIVGAEADPVMKARMIHDWVYEKVEKKSTLTLPTATEVLTSMRGDCNEHTVLYTALARAAGIPTRMAAGLAYVKGNFYYHAWPEVYLGRWVAVDPTFGQFPADASHIRLVVGEFGDQMPILSVIGKIRIEGIEYK